MVYFFSASIGNGFTQQFIETGLFTYSITESSSGITIVIGNLPEHNNAMKNI